MRFNGIPLKTATRLKNEMALQSRKRPIGHRLRIEALPTEASAPNQRWATDLCRLWGGRDGWLTLALVMD
jgi:putative transposase